MQRFTELKVWQQSHQLVLSVYAATRKFPAEERFCLVSQIRRAAVSVPANIAEGTKRQTNADYARFLNLAESSIAELEYLLILGRDLEYVAPIVAQDLFARIAEIARMLHGLRTKVVRR